MSWGRFSLVALVGFSTLLAREARAQSTPVDQRLFVALSYEAVDSCPSESDFRAIVRSRLGRDPFVDSARARVSAVVSSEAGQINGKLVWRDESGSATGEQDFPSKTNRCAQVVAAMGFALAVQIQLLEVDESAPPAPTTTVTQPMKAGQLTAEAAPTRGLAQRDEAANVDRSRRLGIGRTMFGAGIAALASVGMSSAVAPGARVFATARWRELALELGGELGAPAIVRRQDGAGVSQWSLLSSAAGCALDSPWSVCAVFKAGTVRASGRDVDTPKSVGAALVQSGLRIGVEQQLSERTYLSLGAEGLVNLTRWEVTLDRVPVWTSSRFAFGSGISLIALFR